MNCPIDLDTWSIETETCYPKIVDRSGTQPGQVVGYEAVQFVGYEAVMGWVGAKIDKLDFFCGVSEEHCQVREMLENMQGKIDGLDRETSDVESFKAGVDLMLGGWKNDELQKLSDGLDGQSLLFESNTPSIADFLLWEMVNRLTAMQYGLKLDFSILRFRKLLLHNDAVNALPQVVQWKKSDRWVDGPFNLPGANWS